MARKRGSRNKGYWFRKGRGWYVGSEPLKDPQGHHIKDRGAEQEAEKAYHVYMAGQGAEGSEAEGNGEAIKADQGYTVKDVCFLYLKDCQNPGTEVYCRKATLDLRYRLLHDFCYGRPPKGKKVHKGYGDLSTTKLIGLHVKEWFDAHKGWNGTRRAAFQALRRAVRYAVKLGIMTQNPIAGFKAGSAGKREAYFTEEQEKAIYLVASPALAEAIRVMIATGARPGEFAHLEARHVQETEDGQLWVYPPKEHKTGWKTKRPRRIPVPTEIAALVRGKMKRHPKGKLFRNKREAPWTDTGMKTAFARLRVKLAEKGITLDPDCTCYGARHTYAKRAIAKGITIEKLAARMGNSPAVCWAHYAKHWEESKDNTPILFEGLN